MWMSAVRFAKVVVAPQSLGVFLLAVLLSTSASARGSPASENVGCGARPICSVTRQPSKVCLVLALTRTTRANLAVRVVRFSHISDQQAHIHIRSTLLYSCSQVVSLRHFLQAAYDRFSETVDYLPRNTISGPCRTTPMKRILLPSVSAKLTAGADVFHSVGPSPAHLALLPQENSIFGIVTETYNLLRSSDVGRSKWIRGAVVLSVQHCLVVRRGKTIRDIKKVLSHEQVREVPVHMHLYFGASTLLSDHSNASI